MITLPYLWRHRLEHLLSQFGRCTHDPFKIITRLTEECGELAAEVNHFEDQGVKREKHGTPSKEKLAKEVKDVMGALMHIVRYYGIEEELETSFKYTYGRLKDEGWID